MSFRVFSFSYNSCPAQVMVEIENFALYFHGFLIKSFQKALFLDIVLFLKRQHNMTAFLIPKPAKYKYKREKKTPK